MFDLEKYYRQAQLDEKAEIDIWKHIASFQNVILWGASYLGKAISSKIKEKELKITCFWDMRYQELGEIDGINVVEPFLSVVDKKSTLVILCIGNTALMGTLLERIKENGYENCLRGDKLYMDICCPFNEDTGINGQICSGSMECRSMFCSKLHNIVKKNCTRDGIFLPNVTFMVTSHCSLKCKYCVAYMNSYPENRKQHFSLEQIEKDIDCLMDSIAGVGSITIQGGEPFLHPDIDKVVGKLLTKRNFGIISIATNGIFRIKEEKLRAFQDARVNVAFSGYYDALPQEILDVYYSNIALLDRMNIPHTVGVRVPEWIIPPTLYDRHYSTEYMSEKLKNCRIPDRCLQVANGRLYPCLYSLALHQIGVADYQEDYLELSDGNFEEKLEKYLNMPFYRSCGHCGGGGGITPMAGEQGYFDFLNECGGKKGV